MNQYDPEQQVVEVLNAGLTTTPGATLQNARQAKKLTIADIAGKLCLSERCVKDLEDDNYEHIVAPIYARGYLRNYARLVGVAEDKVISLYDQLDVKFSSTISTMSHNEESTVPKRKMLPVYGQSSSVTSKNILRWLSIAVLLGAIVLMVMWWQNQRGHSLDNPGVIGQPVVNKNINSDPGQTVKDITQVPVQQTPQANAPVSVPQPTAPVPVQQAPMPVNSVSQNVTGQ